MPKPYTIKTLLTDFHILLLTGKHNSADTYKTREVRLVQQGGRHYPI